MQWITHRKCVCWIIYLPHVLKIAIPYLQEVGKEAAKQDLFLVVTP